MDVEWITKMWTTLFHFAQHAHKTIIYQKLGKTLQVSRVAGQTMTSKHQYIDSINTVEIAN